MNAEERLFDGRKLRAMVANSGVIKHEFFQQIRREPEQAVKLLRAFAEADYLVAKGFAQFLAHLVSLVEEPRVRMLLVGNLWDEHGLGNPEAIHFVLYKRLLFSLGVPEPRVVVGTRAPFLQLHYDIAAESVLNGIAVFTYANEFLSMYEFSQVRAACKGRFANLDEQYFQTNQEADVVHTTQLESALEKLITTQEELEGVNTSVLRALHEREKFYDTVVAAAYHS
jgi:pyrroloquinoline quinone (PQQ) biosynthesis protein C